MSRSLTIDDLIDAENFLITEYGNVGSIKRDMAILIRDSLLELKELRKKVI